MPLDTRSARLLTSALIASALIPLPGAAAAAKPLRLELRIRVARCEGRPVKDKAWIKEHVAAANKLYQPHGVRITARIDHFTPERCELLTRAHRDTMAPFVDSEEVTVLVLQRVRDVDKTDYNLMGVHWRYRGKSGPLAGRRWVLLTARARPPVLAHELGHYLGLRHDPAGGNLMTPGPSDPAWRRAHGRPRPYAPRFTRAQVRRLRAAVRRLTRRSAKPTPNRPASSKVAPRD